MLFLRSLTQKTNEIELDARRAASERRLFETFVLLHKEISSGWVTALEVQPPVGCKTQSGWRTAEKVSVQTFGQSSPDPVAFPNMTEKMGLIGCSCRVHRLTCNVSLKPKLKHEHLD